MMFLNGVKSCSSKVLRSTIRFAIIPFHVWLSFMKRTRNYRLYWQHLFHYFRYWCNFLLAFVALELKEYFSVHRWDRALKCSMWWCLLMLRSSFLPSSLAELLSSWIIRFFSFYVPAEECSNFKQCTVVSNSVQFTDETDCFLKVCAVGKSSCSDLSFQGTATRSACNSHSKWLLNEGMIRRVYVASLNVSRTSLPSHNLQMNSLMLDRVGASNCSTASRNLDYASVTCSNPLVSRTSDYPVLSKSTSHCLAVNAPHTLAIFVESCNKENVDLSTACNKCVLANSWKDEAPKSLLQETSFVTTQLSNAKGDSMEHLGNRPTVATGTRRVERLRKSAVDLRVVAYGCYEFLSRCSGHVLRKLVWRLYSRRTGFVYWINFISGGISTPSDSFNLHSM